jgi:hypothetical protein
MVKLDPDHIVNALIAHVIAMVFEGIIIVKIVEWRHHRNEDERLAGYRIRTRNLLSRRLTDAQANLTRFAEALARLRLESAPEKNGLPSIDDALRLLLTVKREYEELSNDFTDRISLLDRATREIYEAWLNQVEAFLESSWVIRRMMLPEFASEWNGDQPGEDRALITTSSEVESSARQLALIAMSIVGKLLLVHDRLLPKKDYPRDTDTELLTEARQLNTNTHLLQTFKVHATERLSDLPPRRTN